MDIVNIPRNHFSLPADTILKSLRGLNTEMQEDEVDYWLRVLRRNSKQDFLPDLPTSRPSNLNENFRLPGIGHSFWSTARDHVFAGVSPPCIPKEFNSPLDTISPEACAAFILAVKSNCSPRNERPVYSIDWPNSTVLHDSELGLLFRMKLRPQTAGIYQDGSYIEENSSLFSYHGTREVVLNSILEHGLRSSTMAHKVTGLWLNDHRPSAVQWNTSLLDAAPFLCCEVLANKKYDRQNADIMQGQSNRRISELKPGMNLPSIIIDSIIMGIPHPNRTQWRKHLFETFLVTFSYLKSLPLHHVEDGMTKMDWAITLYQVTAARVAYRESDGAMKTEFGGPFTRLQNSIIAISIAITKLLDALQTVSERNRANKLQNFSLSSLPRPIREVMLVYFPELRMWTNRNLIAENPELWTLGLSSKVDQWFSQ